MRNSKKGLTVEIKDQNKFEKGLRKFKKKVEEDGRLKEFRAKQEFVSKSEQRKISKKKARSRHLKRLRDEKQLTRQR